MSTVLSTERDPLLPTPAATVKKPFYRPRPLWLVPFVITTSVVRGMTIAPRVQVFAHLSCSQLYSNKSSHSHGILPVYPLYNQCTSKSFNIISFQDSFEAIYKITCHSDAAVQSRTARFQTILITTMGIMSALTTGWWGHFGQRHGRTRVLAASTFGILITDFVFYLVSKPGSPWAANAQILFIVAPFFEGLLGGWSTLQASMSAYISDCTSDGSRVQVFSRMTGVIFLGLAIGPTVGAVIMYHPLFSPQSVHTFPSMAAVFEAAVIFNLINVGLLFLYPESLNTKHVEDKSASDKPSEGIFESILSSLAMFLPTIRTFPSGRKRRDWSFTFLACGVFAALFSYGIAQFRILYGQNTYSWSAEMLSYYLSATGGLRALFLLLILPWVISKFKPVSPSTEPLTATGLKPTPSIKQLLALIKFDQRLLRFSLFVDVLSNFAVIFSPRTPEYDLLFIAFTSLQSLGSGSLPAANSLALSMMKLNGDSAGGSGKLFGAFAMLQSVGSMILGPLTFGLIYGTTVASYPTTIFVTAASMSFISLLFIFLTKPRASKQKQRESATAVLYPRDWEDEGAEQRGRSRVSKNLRRDSEVEIEAWLGQVAGDV